MSTFLAGRHQKVSFCFVKDIFATKRKKKKMKESYFSERKVDVARPSIVCGFIFMFSALESALRRVGHKSAITKNDRPHLALHVPENEATKNNMLRFNLPKRLAQWTLAVKYDPGGHPNYIPVSLDWHSDCAAVIQNK